MSTINIKKVYTNFICLINCSQNWLNIFLLFCTSKGFRCDNSMIDEDHLKNYPYCGSMFYPSLNPNYVGKSTSRVTNSKMAENVYRWIVKLNRKNLVNAGDLKTTSCSGSVITERYNDCKNENVLKFILNQIQWTL